MDMDYRAWQVGLMALNFIGNISVGVYVWISNKHKANTSAIEEVKDVMLHDARIIEGRLARVESDIKNMPTHKDIGTVYERVNEVAETLSTVKGQLGQMNTSVQMIHEHLLNQGTRK